MHVHAGMSGQTQPAQSPKYVQSVERPKDISNSMVEMYTMQKYLQYGALRRNDLLHFDAWASTFGETVTAIELSPEGYTFIGR